MGNIQVAIGVPVYGVEQYIEKCATSLFSQTYSQIDFYFVDDCSKDRSISILEDLIRKYPHRRDHVHILHHKYNRGLAASRNTVLENANADFIIWVDSDDWLEVDAVEQAVQKQIEENSDIVNLGFMEHTKKYNKTIMPLSFESNIDFMLSVMTLRTPHYIWSRLIRMSLYNDNNIRCIEGVNMAEDWQVLPILAYYAKKISSLQSVLCHYNCMNPGSYTKTRSEELNRQYWMSYENNERFFISKGVFFMNAVKTMELTIAVDRILNYAKFGYDFYYDEAIKHIGEDKINWDKIPILKRGILYLYKNKFLLIVYVRLLSTLHHSFLFIKSYLKTVNYGKK